MLLSQFIGGECVLGCLDGLQLAWRTTMSIKFPHLASLKVIQRSQKGVAFCFLPAFQSPHDSLIGNILWKGFSMGLPV